MHKTVLKTDLSAYTISRIPTGDPTSFVTASYWDGCPIARERTASCLPLFSGSVTTRILSAPSIRPWDPGVYYRLPLVACDAMGFDGPLSLIPLRVEIEHAPSTAVHVDEHSRMTSLGGEGDKRVYSTVLAYGSHTLCGLFPTETAKKWAALPCAAWSSPFVGHVERRYGIDPSWLRPLGPGDVCISHSDPLLTRSVEVYRETA